MAFTNLRNVDLNLLLIFETVFAAGSISGAAQQLSLTQPAVSNALARLREHFDDPLFVREGRGVKPTSRSQQMIEPVREALQLIRRQFDGDHVIDLATYKRHFRVVVIDPLEALMMPGLLREITRRAPHIVVENRPPTLTNLAAEIVAGTIDLACYTYPSSTPGLVIESIGPVDYVVIARKGHPAIGKTLSVKTFMSLGHVGLIDELRAHANVHRDVTTRAGQRRMVYLINKIWSIPPIVGNTDLVAVIPRRFAEWVAPIYGLSIHAPPVPIANQDFHMIWHQKNNDDPGHQWLRQTIMASMEQSGPSARSTVIAPRSSRSKRKSRAGASG
jgi:DNA-binding transcriptional LysR family regulator